MELARELGASLGTVSYHVRQLSSFGLIELVDEKPRRGAVEHFYRARARPRITDAAWAEAPDIVKRGLIGASLEQLSGQVNASASVGGFEKNGAALIRMPVIVDAQGWDELAELVAGLMPEIERIAGKAEKRLKERDHDGELSATVVGMLFETVGEPMPPATPARRGRRRSRRTPAGSGRSR